MAELPPLKKKPRAKKAATKPAAKRNLPVKHAVDPALCFVKRLPAEILLEIFTYCKYFDTDASRTPWWVRSYVRDIDRPWPTMLCLSHVCQAWRHFTHTHGYLWTEILVDNLKWTQLYIKYSSRSPLHLSFDPFAQRCPIDDGAKSAPHFRAATRAIKALDRVRELDICGPVNADALSILFTAGEKCATTMFRQGFATFNPDNPGAFIPAPKALRILSLQNFETNRHMRLFHSPLTSLTLTKAFVGSPDDSERLVSPLVEIIRQMPTLEHLDVTSPIYEPEDLDALDNPRGPHTTRAFLPNLKSLYLHDELPQALSFIESLELPPNVKFTLVSEPWGEYDDEEMMHESAREVPSHDPRLRAFFDAQYGEASKAGSRFTRLNIMDSQEPENSALAIAVELADPSTPPLPESVLLTLDCEMYVGGAGGSKAVLRHLPLLPPLDGVRNLELYIRLDEAGWRELCRSLTAITRLTVHTAQAAQSFLRVDKASERPLFPHLECVTLDGCIFFEEWDELLAFLRRRSSDAGRTIQWQSTSADFKHTREEEKELLDKMERGGFAPLKWCRPEFFNYETVSAKDKNAARFGALPIRTGIALGR
ncbi:unnamed protein product [Peniophora sp. CBMAI 1063]|nr:unnamed protein product [Peniophora sp. CBMAI 1063]